MQSYKKLFSFELIIDIAHSSSFFFYFKFKKIPLIANVLHNVFPWGPALRVDGIP